MRRSMKLAALVEKVEATFSEARQIRGSGLVPITDSEFDDLRVSIAEDFLHLNHHKSFFMRF